MGTRDPRIDAYIAKSAEFARPILSHLRETIHAGCPDVEETLKWSAPSFMHHGILCGFAAFKQHAAFGFWKGSLVVETPNSDGPFAAFGHIRKLSDLPSKKVLISYVRKAMQLNEDGIKAPSMRRKTPKPSLRTPADLSSALKKNRKAGATFAAFSPSAKREYVEWLTEAKTDTTRARRLASAIEWMAEGKQRNWKYMK